MMMMTLRCMRGRYRMGNGEGAQQQDQKCGIDYNYMHHVESRGSRSLKLRGSAVVAGLDVYS